MKAQFLFSIHAIALWSLMGIQPQINPEKGPGQKAVPTSISDEGPVQVSSYADENVFGVNQRADICPLNKDLKRIKLCMSRCHVPSIANTSQFCFKYCQEFLYVGRQ